MKQQDPTYPNFIHKIPEGSFLDDDYVPCLIPAEGPCDENCPYYYIHGSDDDADCRALIGCNWDSQIFSRHPGLSSPASCFPESGCPFQTGFDLNEYAKTHEMLCVDICGTYPGAPVYSIIGEEEKVVKELLDSGVLEYGKVFYYAGTASPETKKLLNSHLSMPIEYYHFDKD